MGVRRGEKSVSRMQQKTASLHKTLLGQDDAEVADLERKLGLTNRKTLPKSFQDDGLDFLLDELDGPDTEKAKRKAEDSQWLADKRRKTSGALQDDHSSSDESSGFQGFEDEDEQEREEEGEEDEEDFESGSGDSNDSDAASSSPVRVRENPYAPPTTEVPAAKYVPPSRRQDSTASEKELATRARRQAQGLINRLTQSNLLAVVGDVEKLYRQYPRQLVTSTVVNILLGQICDPATLSDTLLVLLAAFSAALYRLIGADFGASLVERLAHSFKDHYSRASAASSDTPSILKETSNLITFLSELYALEVVRCNIMFDHVRLLLGELTELNAELLLRIVRTCGQLLRRDDPLVLKDVIALIRQAVSKAGEENISVRAKFMIETLNDLKNNRAKANTSTSAVVSEHRSRTKKLLGMLGSRKLGASEPLGMGLEDILSSNKKGKWWLVGASWAGNTKDETAVARDREGEGSGEEDGTSSDGDSDFLPDIAALARQNGMNTDIRRAIFAALVLATDCEDGYLRLQRLRLNKHQQREIPAVVMQCAGAEKEYNHYYTLVARRLCSSHKMRWGFQDKMWKLFRRLGESLFGEEAEDEPDGQEEEEDEEEIGVNRAVNLGKMTGFLVARGSMSLVLLKCLNLVVLQPKTKVLVEALFVTALLQAVQDKEGVQVAITRMLGALDKAGPGLTSGTQWFLKKIVRKSAFAEGKAERNELRKACRTADQVLQGMLQAEERTPSF